MCLKDRRLLLRVAKLPRVKTVPVYIPVTVGRGLSPTFLCAPQPLLTNQQPGALIPCACIEQVGGKTKVKDLQNRGTRPVWGG